MRQFYRPAVALLIVVLVAGCAGSADSTGEASGMEATGTPGAGPGEQTPDTPGAGAGNEAPGSAGAPGAPGLPGPGSPDEGARAPESPITIPPFQQIGGQPVDAVRPQIEDEIRKECKPRHDLCVTTVVVPRNGAGAHACFGGTDPPTHPDSASLPRRAVLRIYSQPGGCGAPEPYSESPPSSDTEPTEESQPPPSGDTEPSDASQPPTSS